MESQESIMNTMQKQEEHAYEPPRANFIPTTIEERMTYCGKGAGQAGGGCTFGCK